MDHKSISIRFDNNDHNLKEDLIEIKSFQKFQLLFEKSKLDNFWCVVMEAFPNLAKKP